MCSQITKKFTTLSKMYLLVYTIQISNMFLLLKNYLQEVKKIWFCTLPEDD
jgi:hypothetical protein